MKVFRNTPIKSKTNDGDLAKQYATVVIESVNHESSLLIRKLVLTSDYGLYLNYDNGYKLLKVFKGKCLVSKWFSIKLSSLSNINDWINDLINNAVFDKP